MDQLLRIISYFILIGLLIHNPSIQKTTSEVPNFPIILTQNENKTSPMDKIKPFIRNSQLITTDPILIDGDNDFLEQAQSNGWTGDGSYENPIELINLNISGSNLDDLMTIRNTSLNFTIKNSVLSGGNYAVKLLNVDNGEFTSNTIFDNNNGIYISNTIGSKIHNNEFSNLTRISIDIYDSSLIEITNSRFSNFENGIDLTRSSLVTILNNTFVSGRASSIGLYESSRLSTITENTITGTSGSENFGIVSYNSEQNHISRNIIRNIEDGITMFASISNIILSNQITNLSSIGISLINSRDNIINQSEFNMIASIGIMLMDSSQNNQLVNNLFYNTDNGMSLSQAENNEISNNTISDSNTGITMISSANNIIEMNTISQNSLYGIDIWTSSSNIIHCNNFLSNYGSRSSNSQAQDYGGSDNEFKYNFWNEWTEPDSNNDNIVDSMYLIDDLTSDNSDNNRDTHPLVSSYEQNPEYCQESTNTEDGNIIGQNSNGNNLLFYFKEIMIFPLLAIYKKRRKG